MKTKMIQGERMNVVDWDRKGCISARRPDSSKEWCRRASRSLWAASMVLSAHALGAATYTVTLDPAATGAENRAAFLAPFDSIANGDVIIVEGTQPDVPQVAELDFVFADLKGTSEVTIQWSEDLTAKVPSGESIKSRLFRFDNAPSLMLEGFNLDGNAEYTLRDLNSYAFSYDALLCIHDSDHVRITNFEIQNSALMAVLVFGSQYAEVSNGQIDHYRAWGIMLRASNEGRIEYNRLSNQYDPKSWPTHSLDLYACSGSGIYYNTVRDTYNAAIQTTGSRDFEIVGNEGENIRWNAYKSDGDNGANVIRGNTWTGVGGYAMFFGGSLGRSYGSYLVSENVWQNLQNVIEPDGSEIGYKFRIGDESGTGQVTIDSAATFTFEANSVHDYQRVDQREPVLFSNIPCDYSITNNTFDTIGPRVGSSPPVYGRVFYSNPDGHESKNTYINAIRYGDEAAYGEGGVLAADFENMNVGQAPTVPFNRLSGEAAGIQRAVVFDEQNLFGKGTDNKILWQVDNTVSANSVVGANQIASSAVVTASFDFYEPTGTSGAGHIVRIGNGNDSDPQTLISVALEEGSLQGVPSYELDQAVHVDIVINNSSSAVEYGNGVDNLASARWDAWIDGTRVVKGGVFSDRSEIALDTPLSALFFRTYTSAQGQEVYIDDVAMRAGAHVNLAFPVNSWAGFPVEDGVVAAEDWIGPANVDYRPFLYSRLLKGWVYCEESYVEDGGGWLYVYADEELPLGGTNFWESFYRVEKWSYTKDWLGWIYTEHDPIIYLADLKKWAYVNSREISLGGAWVWVYRE